ncbi:hypothetical protein B0O80DRAFT_450697 [Mortierella sp. GBAus27b]|nr:hypothetical protein BGX31_006645 [Mortierella sp. GBA43]KAI8354285.1 hypothetical protein B0O80DRAFT_450697 [Mortierella sp. GBAus27b]
MSSPEIADQTLGIPPLDLPEIESHVSKYLRQNDLVRCIRVNKTWYKTFLPALWSDVFLCPISARPHEHGPGLAALREHAHFVRKMGLDSALSGQIMSLVFPNLRTLHFTEFMDQRDKYLVHFLDQHKDTVTDLELITYRREVWKHFSSLGKVRRLDLREMVDMSFPKDTLTPNFWRFCTRLEILCLTMVANVELLRIPDKTRFPRLREVRIQATEAHVETTTMISFLRRCPNLETAAFPAHGIESGLPVSLEFVRHFAAGAWPKLRGVRFGAKEMTDEDTAVILRSFQQPCYLFGVGSSGFGPKAFPSLRRHFSTLEHLILAGCRSVTSDMIQEVLSSCPLLKTFWADGVNGRVLANGRPWVCHGLVSLKVRIEFILSADRPAMTMDEKSRIHRRIYEKLATLRRIESINVGRDRMHEGLGFPHLQSRFRGLELQLGLGLDLLTNLKNLKSFEFQESVQRMTQDEICWILKHWVNLGFIHGTMDCINPDKNDTLRHMLLRVGISTMED